MESADVSDISNSPAYQSLDELVASGKLTQPQAQLYRSKYAKLHEVVLKTYENEKNLLKKAKLLNQDLTAEKGKLEKTAGQAQEDSEAIAALRAEMAKGENELSLREERELLLQQEVQDLAATRDELETEVSDNTRRLAAELQPQIDQLEAAVGEARGELNRHKAALKKLDAERAEAAQRAQQLRGAKTDVEVQRAQLVRVRVRVGP
jgi:chromosome segregation ATPase